MKREDFAAFFAEVNDGHRPFAWQSRLLEHLVMSGRWPDRIVAPTGSGKSSVVDVHVFAAALSATGGAGRMPRRLAFVVNRRALVDSHMERAARLAGLLADPAGPITAEVADALRSLTAGTPTQSPALVVVNLRGGVPPTREWLSDPRACAVIAATPDMWGSRALFRGYGTARNARPREAGLLTLDTALVLDEAHLNRQLLHTARRIAELTAFDAEAIGCPALQVVETTATPASGASGSEVGVVESDLDADPALADRLGTPKPVTVHTSVQASPTAAATPAYVQQIVELARAARAAIPQGDDPPRTVGVVVNRVHTAAAVAAALEKGGEGTVLCWVGRMRPLDLAGARERHPNAFTVTGDPQVAYLVATQTVEVGIDLDLAAMVTELAPASSLVQRAGRVNRRGLRASGPVHVIAPAAEQLRDSPPYVETELRAAREWLSRVASHPHGLAPWGLSVDDALRPPAAELGRYLTTLEHHEVELLTQTTEDLFAEPELAFYLRDDLAAERDPVSIVMRTPLPGDDSVALALLQATPPAGREMFPAHVATARALLSRTLEDRRSGRAFLWRDGAPRQIFAAEEVRPGDVVVVGEQPWVLQGVVLDLPHETDLPAGTVWGENGVSVVVRGHGDDDLLRDLAESDGDELVELAESVGGEGTRVQVSVDDGNGVQWAVFTPVGELVADGELRQEWTPNTEWVTLAAHVAAVRDRAQRLAEDLGLPESVCHSLAAAGEFHDAGKRDPSFQRMLDAPAGTAMAKSRDRLPQHVRRRRAAALQPTGWRHEQLSAVRALAAPRPGTDPELVARLAGTSHGRGRPFFPHGAGSLMRTTDPADDEGRIAWELFETGAGWSDILEQTHERYGLWGCAYLEAVLRAADGQVSGEGS